MDVCFYFSKDKNLFLVADGKIQKSENENIDLDRTTGTAFIKNRIAKLRIYRTGFLLPI